ncbi:sugar-binding domain-containing protein [Pontiella agarivorans]|uniref:Glycoside hydrolase family 2 TIM barrel-domain containing protein n=1 Tax=Pontiella agarivorans TaxID=3038953 RepID=A0ABU5MUI1_9BACT|nr:sugar-binding domain-containing protein [Pontiella agarivorans]MDZ8117876.1 glycoside hydrolase family 2 TIM barrel-domain containing protein [Pontiella agarivorans]
MKLGLTAAMAMGMAGWIAHGGEGQNFSNGWKFLPGDVPSAKNAAFDDSAWRELDLPHDWSVEYSFTTNHAGGCTAFLPGGIGWYRKTFEVSAAEKGQIFRIDFDGVYNNSEVWINGHYLGKRPFGYIPFSYELTEYLNYGGKNTVAVRVDRSAYLDCRWYPGSGIYRDVKWVAHGPVHIEQYGVFVTTRGDRVQVDVTLKNRMNAAEPVLLKVDLQDAAGKSVGFQTLEMDLAAGAPAVGTLAFTVGNPERWEPDHPYLYRAEVEVVSGDRVLDRATTGFGIRDIYNDPDKGFFLNGEHMRIKGVCLHHDGGAVGAAVPDAVWERRLRYLKEAGCNAIRTAHNPPSEAFLDLCDRMGFLVQDEAFDEWFNPKDKRHNFNAKDVDDLTRGYSEEFGDWAERDIKAMVLRDRNHPSIIQWSIGNEIEWTYAGYSDATGYWDKENEVSYYWDLPPFSAEEIRERFSVSQKRQGEHILAEQAADLSRWIKELDTTRPVTANMVMPSVSHFSGYADALDVVGYSYRTVLNEWGHEHYPEKMICGTENWVQWEEWKSVLENEHIAGVFLWTGIDYLGESRDWPKRSTASGMLNTAGFRKPRYWFFKTFWKEDEPLVYIAAQPQADSNYLLKNDEVVENPENPRDKKWWWPEVSNHWNFEVGEPVYIELYSNCEENELFLNGKSLGVRKLADHEDRLLKWIVPFEEGSLKAVGRNNGQVAAIKTLHTAAEAVAVRLKLDKKTLRADGRDAVHCVAEVVDEKGRSVRHRTHRVRFSVEGDARNIGVDNGNSSSVQDFQSDRCETDQGRVLMMLQAGKTKGDIVVNASVDGLKGATVRIQQQ